MTAAVSSRQPSGTPPCGRSDQSLFKVHWNLSPPQVHTQHVHFQRGSPRFSNEVRVHWFSSPPFGFPFHPFPFAHICFPLFFHVLLSSCFVISSFLLFAHTSALALVCTRTSTYTITHRFQVAQVLTMRWVSSVVHVHLVSLSLQPHTPLPRLVPLFMSSSFCLCCERAHFASPRGGVCVCVPLRITQTQSDCVLVHFPILT